MGNTIDDIRRGVKDGSTATAPAATKKDPSKTFSRKSDGVSRTVYGVANIKKFEKRSGWVRVFGVNVDPEKDKWLEKQKAKVIKTSEVPSEKDALLSEVVTVLKKSPKPQGSRKSLKKKES